MEIEERKFSFDHNWFGSWDLGLSSPVPELSFLPASRTLFSPARVPPLYGEGRKEISGTGLGLKELEATTENSNNEN